MINYFLTNKNFPHIIVLMAKTNGSPLVQLEETLDLYFGKKAPALPSSVKEIIVNFAPWITLIMVVVSLPAVLALLGIGSLLAPFSFMNGANSGFAYMLSLIFLAASVLFEALAIPGLFKKSRQGWNFVFYSTLVGILSNLVNFNLSSLIIGGLISFYFLFQIKSYYK